MNELPERIESMEPPNEARIEEAVEKASFAFWAAFAAEFPEITTGDLTPGASFGFDQAVMSAAREWVEVNSPAANAN